MKTLCAWHPSKFGYELEMGIKEPLADTSISHGICKECMFQVIGQSEIEIKQERFDKEWQAFNEIRLG